MTAVNEPVAYKLKKIADPSSKSKDMNVRGLL